MQKYVSYLRVSTQRQGKSGLGLEAQRQAVEAHARNGKIIREFVEIESGKLASRPQLDSALRECTLTGATLLVAKLDRLARNVEFTARLMNSGVDFIAADNPTATRLTIHILAAMAEHEREQISLRTKAALAAAKRKGKRLGGPRARKTARRDSGWCAGNEKLGGMARAAQADAFALRVSTVLEDIGNKPLGAIAAELIERGIQTPRGGTWTATAVSRIKKRLENK